MVRLSARITRRHWWTVFALLCLVSSTLAKTTSSKYYQTEKQREREERRRRLDESKRRREERQSRREDRERRRQSKSNNNSESKENTFDFDEFQKFATQTSFLQQPKDVFEGTIKGLQSLCLGGAVGLMSFVGIPLIGVYSQMKEEEGRVEKPSPVLGFIAGAILGGLAGTASTVVGVGTALYQVATGLWNTAGAFKAQASGKKWDPINRTWAFYSLKLESEELNLTGKGTGRRSGAHVTDTTYYDVLGVNPSASRGEIKRAYYKMAKEKHPDKSDKPPEEAADEFLKLHQAYQTLSDDDKRNQYDQWGSSSDGGEVEIPFDPSIFFAVMYDFQKVEPYIGELTIASLIDGVLKLSQIEDPSHGVPKFLMDHFWIGDASPRPRKRQVEIAQNLLSRVQKYVDGEQSKEEFRQDAKAEAETITFSSADDLLGFNDKILDAIGAGLRLDAGRFRANALPVLGWPEGTFYTLNLKKNRFAGKMHSIGKTIQLVRNTYKTGVIHYDKEEGTIGVREQEGAEADASQKQLYGLLPDVMDMAGAYILNDISSAIQGACWRIFFDTSVDKKIRFKRSEAIEILGQEFLLQSRRKRNEGKSEEECLDKDDRTEVVREKIMRAFEISQMKAKGQDGFQDD